jgi:GNAT superfamily N-acetyltransferase
MPSVPRAGGYVASYSGKHRRRRRFWGPRDRRQISTHAATFGHTRRVLEITVGGPGDIGEINRLYASIGWSEPGGIRRRDHYHLAREDGRLVGAVLLWLDDEVDLLPEVWVERFGQVARVTVHEVVVATSYRRRGVGRALMAAVARSALDRGIPYLWAWPSPRGDEKDRQGRLSFFKSCAMDIFNEDADHLVAVGRAEDIERCQSGA